MDDSNRAAHESIAKLMAEQVSHAGMINFNFALTVVNRHTVLAYIHSLTMISSAVGGKGEQSSPEATSVSQTAHPP